VTAPDRRISMACGLHARFVGNDEQLVRTAGVVVDGRADGLRRVSLLDAAL